MELKIGNKLKELRHSRSLTQEEVAAHLGISYQAISKWERSDGYPDITMLPALASYFEVSVDDLLGVNEIAAKERYDEINSAWELNNAEGRNAENAELMRGALKDYPNDPLLLVQLSTSLEKLDGSEGEKRSYLRESAAVQEQILRYCKDSEIRGATLYNICFTYRKLGELDKAISEAKKLANLYKARENALVALLQGEEKYETAKLALEPLKWAAELHLNALAEVSGNENFSAKAKEICRILSEAQETAQ